MKGKNNIILIIPRMILQKHDKYEYKMNIKYKYRI